jgi:hypothetical protein
MMNAGRSPDELDLQELLLFEDDEDGDGRRAKEEKEDRLPRRMRRRVRARLWWSS